MARNGFRVARLRVLPKFVLFFLPAQHATVPAEMPEESTKLHPIVTSSWLASGGSARKDSSRL
jgi:hypothetical protein